MSRLVKECLSALRLSGPSPDPLDEAKAQELFEALNAEGEPLNSDMIRRLALESGWPDPHANRLAELARQVAVSQRTIAWNHRNWGAPTVAMIKGELERTGR